MSGWSINGKTIDFVALLIMYTQYVCDIIIIIYVSVSICQQKRHIYMLIVRITYGKADFHLIAECFLVSPILKLKTTTYCGIDHVCIHAVNYIEGDGHQEPACHAFDRSAKAVLVRGSFYLGIGYGAEDDEYSPHTSR